MRELWTVTRTPARCAAPSDLAQYRRLYNLAEIANSRLRGQVARLQSEVVWWRMWCHLWMAVAGTLCIGLWWTWWG